MNMMSLDRRAFLRAGGSLVVSFALPLPEAAAVAGPGTKVRRAIPVRNVATDQVDGFLAIDNRGEVTVYSGKVDLGTGVRTALSQIAAEELSVPLTAINLIEGDTATTPDQGPTFGSLSIQVGGMQIRQAAATAREALAAQAAEKLGVARADLKLAEGKFSTTDGKSVSYAELVGNRDFKLAVDPKAPLKSPRDYTVVGQSVPRIDLPRKLSGRYEFIHDFQIPGMYHARVVRPAGVRSTLVDFDDAACKMLPGYVTTIRRGNFLAVVAEHEWIAVKASRVLKANWSEWKGLPEQARLWEYVRNTKESSRDDFQKVGATAEALKTEGARTLSATYDFAMHTHGSLGPSCAVAEVNHGKLFVWSGSQQTHLLRKQIATMLGKDPADVRCLYLDGSGCYGRNGHEDAAADAALIAVELGEHAVRVQWMREEEHGWDPKGPPTLLDMKAALDAQGKPIAWESDVYIPKRPKDIAVTLVAADHADLPREEPHPGNIHASLAIPYGVPNIRATAHWLEETPLRPSWIRTPGRMQNTFANESFLDELAHAAKADPLEYRIGLLKDARGLELLERLRKLADWKPRAAPAKASGDVLRGRGLSYVKYELVRTYVGVVADVAVNRKTGEVRVEKFFVAHDCGQIINPDGLRNQIDGNVIQTVSRTLFEELKFDRSAVTSLDWRSYRTIRFPEVPEVLIDLIDRPEEKPWGAGEPTAAVIPSAVANAIFDATGVRLRSVPFTPDKVLAGLKALGGKA